MITVNLRYSGKNGNARKFAEEMTSSGTVEAIRAEAGNLRYEYYQPLDDPEKYCSSIAGLTKRPLIPITPHR